MTTSPPRRGPPPEWADKSFRSLLEAAPDAMLVVDGAGAIVLANLQGDKLFGYGRHELLGRSVESLIPPRLRTEHQHHRETFFGDPRVRPMAAGLELFALRGDGTEVPVEISLSPLTTESGTFIISAIRDVTGRRRTEELKASEERSRRLVQSSSVAMIVSRGLEQKIELMNDKFTALFGYTLDDVPDVAHWWPLAYPDEGYRQAIRTEWQTRVESAIRSLSDIEPMEVVVRCKDGSTRHIEVHLSCMGDTNLVTFIDLTERKLVEQERLLSEKRFRQFFETMPEFCYMVSLSGEVLEANSAACAALGYAKDEIVGKPLSALYAPECVPKMRDLLKKWKADGELRNEEMIVITKEGQRRTVLLNAGGVRDSNGDILHSTSIQVDITERKRGEEALRESEERFRLAAQAGKMYAYEWDIATDMILRSPEYVNILGFSGPPKQLTRQQILDRVHPYDHALLIGSIDQLTPANPTTQIIYRMLRPDGALIWLETSGRAFFDAQGKLVRMIGMVADITERKLAEEALERMSHRLIEAQEQERRRIARELHDDTSQRLAMLGIQLEQIKNDLPKQTVELRGRMDELWKYTVETAKGVRALAYELHSPNLEYLSLTMKAFCQEFGERQKLEIDFKTHDLPSLLPPDISLCLFRILQEALHNSAKHSGAQRLEVELWGASNGVHLTVNDSGKGFEVEAAQRGDGLGLTSMEERVKFMNGAFSIQSQPSRGTTIHVRLPLSAESDSMRAAG